MKSAPLESEEQARRLASDLHSFRFFRPTSQRDGCDAAAPPRCAASSNFFFFFPRALQVMEVSGTMWFPIRPSARPETNLPFGFRFPSASNSLVHSYGLCSLLGLRALKLTQGFGQRLCIVGMVYSQFMHNILKHDSSFAKSYDSIVQ